MAGWFDDLAPVPRGQSFAGLTPQEMLDREMSYDGTHPVRQETINRAEMRDTYHEMVNPIFAARQAGSRFADAVGGSDYLGAAIEAGSTALDLIPGAGALAAIPGAVRASKGIRAYHGSPHSFDKFSMDKIGTGEGAQAYGHGLYFAENEGVARGYRDALSGAAIDGKDPVANAWDVIYRLSDNDPVQRADIRQSYVEMAQDNDKYSDFARRTVEAIDSGAVDRFQPPGSMYEVNINADPADFLDWDAPLSEQPEGVRQLASDNRGNLENRGFFVADERPASELVRSLRPEELTGNSQAYGIPGIKYRDAGSRGADGSTGTRNYVVFDDNLIEIMRKYGIAGLIGGGALMSQYGEGEVQ